MAKIESVTDYIKALNAHDWDYDYSDDFSVWKRGSEQRDELRDARIKMDPDFTIWNMYCPEHYRIPPKGSL